MGTAKRGGGEGTYNQGKRCTLRCDKLFSLELSRGMFWGVIRNIQEHRTARGVSPPATLGGFRRIHEHDSWGGRRRPGSWIS